MEYRWQSLAGSTSCRNDPQSLGCVITCVAIMTNAASRTAAWDQQGLGFRVAGLGFKGLGFEGLGLQV